MTDEELVARLRVGVPTVWEKQAADRIEALVGDKQWIIEERDRTFALMLARAEAAEAKVEKLVEAAEGLSAILDKNETKGPLPDTVLMFCWLAAQNVRAVLRGYMLENPE